MPPLAVLSARAPPRRLPDPPPRSPPVLRLPVTPPVTWGPALRALAAHGVPGIEETDVAGGRHTGSVPGEHGAARVTVTLVDGADHVPCAISPADPADLPAVTAAVRRWLDLDHDPGPVDAHLATDPRLAPLVAARPGLRVVGSTDPWETAATTVLGQQVSVAAARTFAGRVVAAYGRRPATGEAAAFPAPSVLAAVDPADLATTVGLTGARARTVHAVATAIADGLPLGPGADPDAVRARLLALPGIGPWTVEYLALRALGDRDACPASDLVLRRALGGVSAREVTATAEAWRPWRAYAVTHLWTAAAYAG